MGVDLYTSFQKYCCFWLEKRGSTYTRINLYTRKYGIKCDMEKKQQQKEQSQKLNWAPSGSSNN